MKILTIIGARPQFIKAATVSRLLHYHTTTIKFGIGRATYDSAQEIRNGDITRQEGIALIKRFDGEFPKQYIQDCCDYMNITMQQYHNAIEKFRSPHLWNKINGKWELKNPIWKDLNG